MQTGDQGRPGRTARIRRRDRRGRGLRGLLAPPDVPLHRSRAERFDELVLQAVARLEPRWEAHLAGVEFAVEEIPPPGAAGSGPVPLARLEPGSGPAAPQGAGWPAGDVQPTGPADPSLAGWPAGPGGEASPAGKADETGPGAGGEGEPAHSGAGEASVRPAGATPRPPRIVVYRRPLLARAESEEDLSELVFEVVVEEFARLLGVDPEDVDPGYPDDI
jgi:predicted Zn-dependent protease with MMP-like domain